MKIVLKNIGSISEASIEISNLTVISGENDTGKTTIAKVVYALGQATSSFKHDYQQVKEYELRRLYEELYINLTRYIDKNTLFSNDTKIDGLDFSEEISDTQEHSSIVLIELLSWLKSGLGPLSRHDFIKVKVPVTRLLDSEKIPEQRKDYIKNIVKNIEEKTVALDKNLPTSLFIHNALKSEFSNEIVMTGQKTASLKLFDGKHKVFEAFFDNKKILKFDGDDFLRIADSTLIEGPAIFQIATLLGKRSLATNFLFDRSVNRPEIPYHVIDLCAKLNGTRDTLESMAEDPFSNIRDWDLSEFYEGAISYENATELFKLSKGGNSYHGNNISSGIKALAVIDLLIKGNYITKNTVLILDEPETNLHPTWQKKYAKAIVALGAKGAKILVNTHSPYMLEALKVYADKVESELFESKFYYASKDEKSVAFVDTDGDISSIISALSAPLYDLIEESGGDIDDF